MPEPGSLHHLELWVPDLARAESTLGWLLGRLGYAQTRRWQTGQSWTLRDTYVVLESGPDVRREGHVRTRPGMNHLAFHAGDRRDVDALSADAVGQGWRLMFGDRHPFAGGPGHYATYLENDDGFEVELVAAPLSRR